MQQLIQKSFSLIKTNGEEIYGDIRYSAASGKMPAVIVLHGYKAWKDWGFFPYVCTKIAESGTICINFSTSLCGVSPGSDMIDKPEKFAANTVLNEIEDTQMVINEFSDGKIDSEAKKLWNGEFIFLGHSRGGTIGIIIAAENRLIRKTISWCPIGKFIRTTPRQADLWKQRGYLEFRDNKTGQMLRINKSHIETIENNPVRLNPAGRLKELDIPVCFIHGKQDMTVPYHESEKLFSNVINQKSEYILIEGTGHTFGVSHPFERTNKALEEVLQNTIKFIHNQ